MRVTSDAEREFITRKFFDGGVFRLDTGQEKLIAYSGKFWPTPRGTTRFTCTICEDQPTLRTFEGDASVCDITHIPFSTRLINHQGSVIIADKVGEQGTQRTLQARHIVLRFITDDWIGPSEFFRVLPKFPFAWKLLLFPKSNPSIEAALQRLRTRPEIALTTQFAITLSGDTDVRPWLWMWDQPVGRVDAVKRTIDITTEALRQEVEDFLSRTSQEWSVV